MADMNNEWKVQLGAELKSGVKKEIQDQLDTFKDLKIDVNKASLGQNIASSVQKQLDKLSINLNIGKINIGNNIKGLSQQVSSQLKSGLGNPLQIFKVSDLQKNSVAYMTKVSKTINKQMAEIQKMANAKGWQDFNVTGIEKADGKIKSLTMTVTDATGALKQLNFQREYIETNAGNKHLGLVQTEDVKIIKTAAQAEKEFIQALDKAKTKENEINRNAVQDLKYDIDTKAFETDIVTLENHLKRFRDVTEQSQDEVVKSFYETKAAYEQLVAAMQPNSGFDDTARLQALEQYQKALEKTNNYVKQLRSDNMNTPIELGDNKRLSMITKLNNYLAKNTAMSKDAKLQIEAWVKVLETSDDVTVGSLQNINTQFKMLDSQLRKSGQLGLSWSDKLKQAWEKFGGWSIATGALTSVFQFIRQMPKEVIAVDTAMTNLYKVTDETSVRYNDFLESATKNAQKLGRTISGLITQTSEWAKLGYSLNEAEQLAQVSSIYANVGEVDDATAVSDMVTAMKAFNIEAGNAIEIVNMYNKLGNEFATSAKDLGSGLSKSASSMATAGTDINKTLAMLTGGSEITQSATEFGNFLKVSSMRLRGMTGELEALGEEVDNTVDSISKVQTQVLNRTGGKVNIFDDMGNFRDYYDVMLDISKVYDDLSSTDKASLTEILFGKMRGNQGAALIQAFQSGQIQKALQATYDAAGSAEEEQAKWLQSEEAKIEQLQASYQSLAQTIFDSSFLKAGTDSLRIAVNLLEEIIDKTGILVPLIGGLSSVGALKNLD